MLRIHFLQQWFNLSDPAMEEALYDTPMFREFAGLDMGEDHLPGARFILRAPLPRRASLPGRPRPLPDCHTAPRCRTLGAAPLFDRETARSNLLRRMT